MRFYGKMLISPIHKPPYEVLAHWEYKDGVWYGNDESFPAEICKFVSMVGAEQPISNPSELVPENDTQELWVLSGRVAAFVAYAALKGYVTIDEIKAMLGQV